MTKSMSNVLWMYVSNVLCNMKISSKISKFRVNSWSRSVNIKKVVKMVKNSKMAEKSCGKKVSDFVGWSYHVIGENKWAINFKMAFSKWAIFDVCIVHEWSLSQLFWRFWGSFGSFAVIANLEIAIYMICNISSHVTTLYFWSFRSSIVFNSLRERFIYSIT